LLERYPQGVGQVFRSPLLQRVPMPRLQEVACLAAVLVAAVVALLSLLPRRPSPFAQCHTHAPILVGTHHKTGTVLLQHIFKEACAILMWRCSFNHRPLPCSSPEEAVANGLQLCFLQHGVRFKLSGGSSYRFVHAIRDPMEVVLSGYDYHLHTTERWANVRYKGRWNGTTYVRYLNALPLSEGLQAELTHSLRDSLKTMPRLLNRTGDNPCTLTVRLEDFEHDWARLRPPERLLPPRRRHISRARHAAAGHHPGTALGPARRDRLRHAAAADACIR
jgi:hypothetical protein